MIIMPETFYTQKKHHQKVTFSNFWPQISEIFAINILYENHENTYFQIFCRLSIETCDESNLSRFRNLKTVGAVIILV